jgi:sulfonate transport system ATP-binding protein
VLLVTHDVEEPPVLADRVVLLIVGRLDEDFRVDLPPPRRRSDPHLAALKEELLVRLLRADALH